MHNMTNKKTTNRLNNHPPSQQNEREILTTFDFVRSKVSPVMGKISVLRAEHKIDAQLKKLAQEDPWENPARTIQNEAFASYRDNLVASYVADKKLDKGYKWAKTKYIAKRIGSAAMWVPGIDIIGSKIQEGYVASRVDKSLKRKYLSKNGGFMGGVKRVHKANQQKFNNEKTKLDQKHESILKNHETWSNI